ncbi:MAG: hypothetical protein ABIQ65_12955 [Thermoanaerobaculia bacterium]
MEFVADTNVWYDLGANLFSAATLKAGGRRLLATPVNHLEICSNVNAASFKARQAAASALLAHADDILTDTESHLANLWGVTRTPPTLAIEADLQTLATASSPVALHMSVPLYPGSRTAKTVDLSLWRSTHWEDFCDGIAQAIDGEVPGYLKARVKGTIKRLPGKNQAAFNARILSSDFETAVFEGTYRRVLRSESLPPAPPSTAGLAAVRPLLAPFARAYAHYIIGCACDFAPQPNDFGDLESFLYLQNGRVLLTSEKRWHKIATVAGHGTLIARPADL